MVWPIFVLVLCSYWNSLLILFAITAAGVVPCGGPKKSPRTSSIVQIIFFFWSFAIREGMSGNQKLLMGLDSFSWQFKIVGLSSVCVGLCVDCPVIL